MPRGSLDVAEIAEPLLDGGLLVGAERRLIRDGRRLDRLDAGAELRDALRLTRRQIALLARIGGEVVELVGHVGSVRRFDELPALGAPPAATVAGRTAHPPERFEEGLELEA